jgi:hypothetical protein
MLYLQPKTEWFEFPDLFPEEQKKEQEKPLEDMKKHQKLVNEQRRKKWDRQTIPDWFGV